MTASPGTMSLQVKDVGRQGIDLVWRERLGVVSRHRAANVVEDRGGVRPVAADGFHGGIGVQGADAADQRRGLVGPFPLLPVALGPELGEEAFPLLDAAAAGGQSRPVRNDVDVPPAIVVIGCAIVGLGLAGVVPTALSWAGALVPTATGAATGAVMMVGYLAFVFGPAAAGALAGAVSLRAVIVGLALAGAAAVALATQLERSNLSGR